VPSWNVSFGASLYDRDEGTASALDEESTVDYDGDLEAFVEKRFGRNLSVRLTAANLLDASKDEVFHKFNTIDDQLARDYDEFELETEEAGPSYQLVMRWAF
jgi:hypothetical protein